MRPGGLRGEAASPTLRQVPKVDDFSEIIDERLSVAHWNETSAEPQQESGRWYPRRNVTGGLSCFLAAGCGLNEGSPKANLMHPEA